MKTSSQMKSVSFPMESPPKMPSVQDTAPLPEAENEMRGLWLVLRDWLKPWFKTQDASLKEVIEEAIEEHEEQADEKLPLEEKRILRNVLSFSDITVNEIMTTRSVITALPSDATLSMLKDHILRHRHTRIPIYRDTLDRMVGFIHVKDLLPMLASDVGFELNALMRDLLFVPPSMRIIDMLVKMRQSRIHMAIVVDEHGGTDGLVTMEDLFEEIVGDIQDEHDNKDEEQIVTRISECVFEASARIRIDALERQVGYKLIDSGAEGFDTLGGLIFFQLGRVPAKGELVPHASGLKFEIAEADPRRIHKVRILTA